MLKEDIMLLASLYLCIQHHETAHALVKYAVLTEFVFKGR
jgi:hypothetical protein